MQTHIGSCDVSERRLWTTCDMTS